MGMEDEITLLNDEDVFRSASGLGVRLEKTASQHATANAGADNDDVVGPCRLGCLLDCQLEEGVLEIPGSGMWED
ncbi:hypothetical protein FRC02_012086 [Tulasnella sp. 418]|nr:hypothetical protein FRC02_012086 [Tulasnella sp. 418]